MILQRAKEGSEFYEETMNRSRGNRPRMRTKEETKRRMMLNSSIYGKEVDQRVEEEKYR